MHAHRVVQHRMVVVEEHVHLFRMACEDAFFDFVEFTVSVVMGVPAGSAVDAFVDDVVAHYFGGELWRVDAHEEDSLGFSPGFDLVGEQGWMSEFDRELLGAYIVDEMFEPVKVGEGGRELEEVVMDVVFEGCEEPFEALEAFLCCWGEFLEVGDAAVYFYDPDEGCSFCRPGFDHVRVREPVEAHVKFDRGQSGMLEVPVQGVALVPGVGPA